MRTPVVLVAGHGDADGVVRELCRRPGTVLVRHTFDGQIVLRTVGTASGTSDWALEIGHGCVSCTVRDDLVELALAHLEPDSPHGRALGPHDPLLSGEPPLEADGGVRIVEFTARRPFHPVRLHTALDVLLDGGVRTRGRAWMANRPDRMCYIESAGGGLRLSNAGKWLAAMDSNERGPTSGPMSTGIIAR